MLIDSQLQFSAAQAVTSTGDAGSTNVYDTGAAADVGIGETPWLVVNVNTTATSSGSATVAVVLQTSTNNTDWTDAMVSQAFAVAALTAKTNLAKWRLPVGLKRYIRVAYRVATAALTAGKFDAFIVNDVDAPQYLPGSYTVG